MNKKLRCLVFPTVLFVVLAASVSACGDDDTSPGTDGGTDGATQDVASDGPADGAGDASDARVDATLYFGLVDRAGRPAIIQALIGGPKKNGYNRGDTFTLASGIDGGEIAADFQWSLVKLDNVDGVDDWAGGSPDGGTMQVPIDAGPDADGGFATVPVYPHPLVAPLRNDVIFIDPNKAFCTDGYLGIENEVITQGVTVDTATSCGGRWLGDDAIDKALSFIVKRNLTGVSDNVNAPTKAPLTTFPYLAPPN